MNKEWISITSSTPCIRAWNKAGIQPIEPCLLIWLATQAIVSDNLLRS